MDDKTHTILVGIQKAQQIENQNNDAYLRSLAMHCGKGWVNKHKHTTYATTKSIKI